MPKHVKNLSSSREVYNDIEYSYSIKRIYINRKITDLWIPVSLICSRSSPNKEDDISIILT